MTSTNQIKPAQTHTPGPWDYDIDYIVAPDPDGRHPNIYIAEIAHSDDEGRVASCEQQDANRRLIAAAPELMEALEELLANVEGLANEFAICDEIANSSDGKAARAAIAKATITREQLAERD
jgi:hypothetical protein